MAPKKPLTITKTDITEFLSNESDFAFEMRVLHKLRVGVELNCEHGGTYIDPITQKARQFDIRARGEASPFSLRLAVECKNLRDTSPLLLHAVERTSEEAFHELIVRQTNHPFRVVRVKDYESTYEPKAFVAKSTDQVARRDDGGFKRGDADVYDKIAQAVSSTHDLVMEAVKGGKDAAIAVIPMLVVPDNRLWQANYSANGNQLGEVREVEYAALFLNRTWEMTTGGVFRPPYTLSHMEIVTLSALETRVASHLHAAPPGTKGVFDLRMEIFNRSG